MIIETIIMACCHVAEASEKRPGTVIGSDLSTGRFTAPSVDLQTAFSNFIVCGSRARLVWAPQIKSKRESADSLWPSPGFPGQSLSTNYNCWSVH